MRRGRPLLRLPRHQPREAGSYPGHPPQGGGLYLRHERRRPRRLRGVCQEGSQGHPHRLPLQESGRGGAGTGG